MVDNQGALKDLDKANVLEPNNASTLRTRENVKNMLKEYQGALEDLPEAYVLEPNNAFTLMSRGDVKYELDDYQGVLEDLDRADVLEQCIHLADSWRGQKDVKRVSRSLGRP